jgi:phosphatidylinositol alpha-1,6-mannosyltransferase
MNPTPQSAEPARLRLLVLACDFPPAFGGIQKLSYGLCRALITEGHDVQVIASAQANDDASDSASGVPTIRCQAPNRLLAAVNAARAVRQLLRSGWRSDAIVATKWSPEGQAYQLSGAGRRVPLVLMGHGREFLPETHRPVRAWAQRAVVRAARGAIACSNFTASQMARAGVAPDRVRVVHPGVDPEEFAPPDALDAARARLDWPSGPTLLTVARLVRRKGVDTVIEALPGIARVVPDVAYVVIGGGPERDRLIALAEDLGVHDRVRMLGSVSDEDKAAAFHLCDVFTMPSRDIASEPPEGFGIVYLEANLCGKPVIGANTGGVSDAIEDGVSGLLVEPDAPGQLAEAASRLLREPAYARSLGEAGRRRAAERFSWPVTASKYAAAIRELIGR